MGGLWVADLGEEVLYEEDLPGCCRRSAHGSDDYSFECPACGATWRAALPVVPEEDAFAERGDGEERKGAA